jgi:NAD(P)-dependent dehydrogenase (short-subunit alcohol dehydrogenase family)
MAHARSEAGAAALQGKVALVTGAGSGIGKATALLLAEAGARVGLLGLEAAELQSVAKRIEADQGQTLTLVADVSSASQMQAAFEKVAERWNKLDIVFANAGINGVWAPLDKLTPEEWDATLAINLKGSFLTLKYALPLLKRAGGSVVINASINGTRVFSNTGATAYACSKAAQVTLAKMAALELAQHQIRVNVICPGAIDTPIHDKTEHRDLENIGVPAQFPEGSIPLTHGSPGKAIDVAKTVVFLASEAASHITGTEIWIDGGESLVRG